MTRTTPAWLVALILGACAAPAPGPDTDRTGTSSPVASLSAPADGVVDPGYARADGPRDFDFPADHGPHPEFQTEWWYLTANLDGTDGNRFGIQWTIFRRALAPDMSERESEWATREIYLGHFAVTDVASNRHHSFERLARGAVGLAGSTSGQDHGPLEVWLEDWKLAAGGPDAAFPWTLEARGHREGEDPVALTLRVRPEKPLVLQGDGGFSRKSSIPGGASYYYSFTRLDAVGELQIDGRSVDATGSAWLDREWSTSVLAPNQTGWDWFALQLEDGRDLMVYRLRLDDGGVDPASSGVLVDAGGDKTVLSVDDFDLEVLDRWTSLEGTTYPIAWRLRLPGHDLDLEVRAVTDDQELDVAFRYWEGAVDVSGRGGESGRGYVELVGYADT